MLLSQSKCAFAIKYLGKNEMGVVNKTMPSKTR